MGRPRTALVLALALAAGGCGFRHIARTLGEDQGEIYATAGGPFLGVGDGPLLVPSARLGGRYGVTHYFDVGGSVAVDALGFGILAMDAYVVQQLYRRPGGFALSISGRAHLLFDLNDDFTTRGFPELGLHMEHRVERWLTVFWGVIGIAQFDPPLDKPPVFAAPYLGAELILDHNPPTRQYFTVQVAWVSPWEDFRSWASWEPAGAGALVLVVGWRGHYNAGTERSFP